MKVLAVGCHPDDLEIACSGTLAKYVAEGADVYMCHVASGSLGHVLIPPEELAPLRRQEAINAGKVLGVKEVLTLGVSDLEVLSDDQAIVDGMIEVIRYTKPDVIITHSPEDYMKDHREVSSLVFDASFSSSIVQKYTKTEYYPHVVPIYYMDTLAGVGFTPELYVDITNHIDTKIQALACHESQIVWMREHDNIDFLDFVRTCSKFRGFQSSVGFAECFYSAKAWPRVTTENLLP